MDYYDIMRRKIREAARFMAVFLKWLVLAALLGGACGLVGTAFSKSIDFVTHLRMQHGWLLFLMPLCGIVIVFLYRVSGVGSDMGTNHVLRAVKHDSTMEKVPAVLAPLIFVGTVLSHLGGASVGREGAALQLGGSMGAFAGRQLRMTERDIRVMTLCGMSGVFAALFGTPLTATFFVIEVVSVGFFHYSALIPCIVSSIMAYSIADYFHAEALHFFITVPEADIRSILSVIALAALCAALSVVYCGVMHTASRWAAKWIKNEYLRMIAGSAVMLLATFLLGTDAYNGAGMPVISAALSGTCGNFDFLWKMLLTALCVGVGFKGGEIVPTLFIGATFGCLVGPLLGLPASFAAAVGLISLFCSVVNCPVASIILSLEMFGTSHVLLFALACCVSFMLSGYSGLYSSQRIIFSKLEAIYLEENPAEKK